MAFEQGLIALVWGKSGFPTSCSYTDFSIFNQSCLMDHSFHVSDSSSKITCHLFQQCFPHNIAGLRIVNIVQSEACVSCI